MDIGIRNQKEEWQLNHMSDLTKTESSAMGKINCGRSSLDLDNLTRQHLHVLDPHLMPVLCLLRDSRERPVCEIIEGLVDHRAIDAKVPMWNTSGGILVERNCSERMVQLDRM
jgi:hypothetical protein